MATLSELLYQHRSYKDYLTTVEQQKLYVHKGFRSRLATAGQCNTPFVSHVLNGDSHFSLEQGLGISQLLGHSEDDQDFFLLLVQFARAGTLKLREFFKRQLDDKLTRHNTLQTRLKARDKLSQADKNRYYSCWDYAAIHVIVTIPHFQKTSEIARRLLLPEARVSQVLAHLEEMGLVQRTPSGFVTGTKQIYLGNDSDLIGKHHTNWRLRTLNSLTTIADSDLHYSSAISISRNDSKKLRGLLVDFIAQVTPIINGSAEEEIFSFNIDLFSL